MLLLLGDGALMEQMKSLVRQMGLEHSVRFMGMVRDCSPYYQAMDAFVMPSIYEALPLTGIEAQCAGLPCLFSETVSAETGLSKRAEFLPIGSGNEHLWVEKLMEIQRQNFERHDLPESAKRFDAGINAKKMAARYEALWGQSV